MLLGGGVNDCYQPAEIKYELTRKALHIFYEYNFPVHILTKSILVKRDSDIIKKINQRNKALVSFSLSSACKKISTHFEPGVPAPQERLDTIKYFKDQGITCGVFLMPVIPFITDSQEQMEQSIVKAYEAGVDFIIFGGMTLKPGKQRQY